MNPQQQFPQGYGVPTAQPAQMNSFANAPAPAPAAAPAVSTVKPEHKLVDYMWQRIAVCAMVLVGGLLIAIIILVVVLNNVNIANAKQEAATNEANNRLNEVYSALNVEDQSAALSVIGQDEMLTGGDIAQIKALLLKAYSSVTAFDATDASTNLVKTNGVYKVVSLKLTNAAGTYRAILYAKLADNQWKLAKYNGESSNPCKDSDKEEKEALHGIVKCPTVVVDDDEEEE
jgi:hypothetical protein